MMRFLVRRKYTRQNKDIARMNSAQAVRIRNLENEIARLLAENLELRGQIISQEAQPQRSRNFVDHVGEIRSQLDDKLREITDLVTKLDRPVRESRRSSVGTRIPRARPRTSEERVQMMESLAEQEGRLPAIVENKSYPRRTLEYAFCIYLTGNSLTMYSPQEIAAMLSEPTNGNGDSPDIGPPPVSHFINEDPVKLDFPTPSADTDETTGFDPALSINLEQRRKRRDVSGSSERRRSSKPDVVEAEDETKQAIQPLKSGAKRKFDISDEGEEEREARLVAISPEEFKYTRKMAEEKSQPFKDPVGPEKPVVRIQREVAIARAKSKDRIASKAHGNTPAAVPTLTRRALGPKTSNTDVANSPKKLSKPPIADDSAAPAGKANNINGPTMRERPRSRNEAPINVQPTAEPIMAPPVDILPELETHASTEDLFSPTASAPSATRPVSRDTPPPQELGQDGEGHRPSRRARASVSYAEPNLRDKMRRETKDSAEAANGESGKTSRHSSVNLEDEPQTAVKIKPEPGTEDDSAWKSKLPTTSSASAYSNSPLSSKVADAAPAPEAPQHRRRGSQSHHASDSEELPKSGPGSAISALMAAAGSRKVKAEAAEAAEPQQDPLKKAFGKLERRMADMDIYEFEGSPPREARSRGAAAAVAKGAEEPLRGHRSSRRQSALGSGAGAEKEKEGRRREGAGLRSAGVQAREVEGRGGVRRKSTLV